MEEVRTGGGSAATPMSAKRGGGSLAAAATIVGCLLLYAAGQTFWAEDEFADPGDLPAVQTRSVPSTAAAAAAGAREAECGPARGDGGAVTAGEPATNPGMWVTTDDYPASALRLNQEGITTVRMAIDGNGAVAACTVTASSGTPALDVATCGALRARARYRPARDAQGCPVPFEANQRVRWQIPLD